MAIRFACPVCKTVFTVHDQDAGKKANCSACGQLVQVPSPPRTKAVLGELVPDGSFTDSGDMTFDEMNHVRAAKAKRKEDKVYRDWMDPGEELTDDLRREIDEHRAAIGLIPPLDAKVEKYDPEKTSAPPKRV